MSKSKLLRGAVARIYRRSGDDRVLESQIATGPGGGVDVRHLAVGQYVACDEASNEVEFEVTPDVELVTLPVQGSRPDAPAEPTGGRDVTAPAVTLKPPKRSSKPKAVKRTVGSSRTEAQKAARRKRDAANRAKKKAGK